MDTTMIRGSEITEVECATEAAGITSTAKMRDQGEVEMAIESVDLPTIELCPLPDSGQILDQLTVTVEKSYPVFEQRIRALPKLRYDSNLERLVLEGENSGEGPAKQLATAFGLTSKDAAILLANLSVKSVVDTRNRSSCGPVANAVLGLIADAHPQDSVEAMLCSLIAAATIQAAKSLEAAEKQRASPFSTTKADPLAVPIRLMNVTAKLAGALSRYRRRGEQRVVVQHVRQF